METYNKAGWLTGEKRKGNSNNDTNNDETMWMSNYIPLEVVWIAKLYDKTNKVSTKLNFENDVLTAQYYSVCFTNYLIRCTDTLMPIYTLILYTGTGGNVLSMYERNDQIW